MVLITNMSESDYDIQQPKAAAITESLRSIGYSIETAIADLIDNSITAGATSISISGEYKGKNTAIFILDDGEGMSEDVLKNAMRLGSASPADTRAKKDLGRFGLGLKTASFSQCRKFSVISKQNGSISGRYWDLDIINSTNEWQLRRDVDQSYVEKLEKFEHGTLIVWEKLDRVISEKDKDAEKRFNAKKNAIKNHLGLTFHRFIESGKLSIKVGGVLVPAWNPFLPEKDFSVKKEIPAVTACGGTVTIKGWVMPHKMYFSDPEYRNAGYNKGWTHMQGFYIYRANRLLVAGGWLGLTINGQPIRQEHHYDLARICVDISNEHDFDWDIDIKKSKATPPDYLIHSLESVAKQTRRLAYETYVFRGVPQKTKTSTGRSVIPLWSTAQERNKKLYYSINSDFPLIKDLLTGLDSEKTAKVKELLKLLAETIPVQNIDFHVSNQERKDFSSPYENCPEELDAMFKMLIESYMAQGFNKSEAEEQARILLHL